jgi:hypothetical protein
MSKLILSKSANPPDSPTISSKVIFYIGSDGIPRVIDNNGDISTVLSSGITVGSGLVDNGIYTDIGSGGWGISLSDSGLFVDSGALDERYAWSGLGGGGGTLLGLTDTSISTPVSGQFLIYNGSDWANAPSGYQVPSGNYATVEQGNALWQPTGDYATGAEGDLATNALQDITGEQISSLSDVSSATAISGHLLSWDGAIWRPASSGYQVPSGNYATVEQGNILWQESGIYLLESTASVRYALSGFLTVGLSGNIGKQYSAADNIQFLGGNVTQVGNTVYVSGAAGGGGSTTFAGLSDTDVAGATSGHILGYDGANWRPTASGAGGGVTTLAGLSDTSVGAATSGQSLRYDGTSWFGATVNQSTNASGWIDRTGTLPVPAPSGTQFIVLGGPPDELFVSLQTTGGSWQWISLTSAP